MRSDLAIDPKATLARVQGDLDLLHEIVALFGDEATSLLAEVRAAIERQDAAALEWSAHTLKGAVANFGAKPAFNAALRLETMGERKRFGQADQACRELEGEISRLKAALAQFVEEQRHPA